MNIPRYKLLLLSAGLLALGLACNELDKPYSLNPNHRLSFSADTLSFDTVFTTIGSATRQFMVYNPYNVPLKIETIKLAKEDESAFRLNVDGRSGRSFANIHLPEKDSLYVFVEVTVDPTGENRPLRIENRLEFTVNGGKQAVVLQAYGQDVNLHKGGIRLQQDTLWTAERPYLIYDSLVVDSGATLRIEKGAVFYMHDKAKWVINGTIKAIGDLNAPIIFRGDRLDELLTDLPYDRLPRQWDGLYFGPESFENEMEHVVVRNGITGLYFAESAGTQSKLKITDSQLTNMEQSVLSAENCHIKAVNTEFSNAGGNIVALSGGDYHFIHCTLANYYVFDAGRQGLPALSLKNYIQATSQEQAEKKHFPLKAVFDNCLIDGSLSEGNTALKGELSIDASEEAELSYRFNHCALKTMATTGDSFVNVQFVDSDHPIAYKSIGRVDNHYVFTFAPDTAKALIGKADPLISAQFPLDRLGIDRAKSEDGPEIGAYEYVPDPKKEND
jgi:hypothetical protein